MKVALWVVLINLVLAGTLPWTFLICYMFYTIIKKVLIACEAYGAVLVWEMMTLIVALLVWL